MAVDAIDDLLTPRGQTTRGPRPVTTATVTPGAMESRGQHVQPHSVLRTKALLQTPSPPSVIAGVMPTHPSSFQASEARDKLDVGMGHRPPQSMPKNDRLP